MLKDQRHEDEPNTGLSTNTLLNDEEVTINDNDHQHTPKHLKPSTVKSENLVSLLPKKTSIENFESIGVLSTDKEGIAFVDPQDKNEIVLSVSQDDEDSQAQAPRGRRLDATTFEARCTITSGGEGFVDCVNGFVRDTGYTETCISACNDLCCRTSAGANACSGFTGKGKSKSSLVFV